MEALQRAKLDGYGYCPFRVHYQPFAQLFLVRIVRLSGKTGGV
jgi:hypothetical protein